MLPSALEKCRSEQQKLPQATRTLELADASRRPMNSPQCRICFSEHDFTVVMGVWGWGLDWGRVWGTLWPLTYTKQMRLEAKLLFSEVFFLFLGKPELK